MPRFIRIPNGTPFSLLIVMLARTLNVSAQVDSPTAVLQEAPLTAPPAGGVVTDPTFGVQIKRLTSGGELGGLATAEYPQLQAFNADETRIMITSASGGRDILDTATGQVTHQGLSLVMPRWSPVDPDVIYSFNRLQGGTIHLRQTELLPSGMPVTTNLINVTSLGFSTLDLGCFEELSDDGRFMTLLDQANSKVSVLDVPAGVLRSTVHLTADVDWVAVSSTGDYLAVQYVTRGIGSTSGLVIYDAGSGAPLGHASDHYEHGDLGLDAARSEVFVSIGYTGRCANGFVACLSVALLPDALERNRWRHLIVMPPEIGSYTSCRNVKRPGFCLHGDDYGRSAGAHPFAREIWLTRLADGAVRRLAHHRSSSCSYFNLTRPTLSPTGRYALFTSDWARPNCSDESDLYLIDLAPLIAGWAPNAPSPDAGMAALDGGSVDAAALDAALARDAMTGDVTPVVDSGAANDAGGGRGPIDGGRGRREDRGRGNRDAEYEAMAPKRGVFMHLLFGEGANEGCRCRHAR